jgi:hypothetical protein
MAITVPRSTSEATGISRTAVVLLVAAPLVMALGRVLLVPLDDQDWDQTMTDMAAHQGRSDLGWVLAIAASGILGTTAAIVAHRLRLAGRAKSSAFVVVTTALGWAGCAAICFAGLYLSSAAEAPDRAAQVQVAKDINDGSSGFVFLLIVIGAIGYVVAAVALARSRVVATGAAVLIGLGGAATLLTMGGPVTPLLVAAALVLAAGHGLALRSLGREPERAAAR